MLLTLLNLHVLPEVWACHRSLFFLAPVQEVIILHLDSGSIAKFQPELKAMGYKFQFVTLAGFHALNYSMFQLAQGCRDRGMAAYAVLQEAEFAAERDGYSATKHQREVGTGYFDLVAQIIADGKSSMTALDGSTEAEQFH
jgi:isocitrate lyase